MTEMEIVCELECNARREAHAAGDPYGPMEGMAMSTRFSLMARKHTVHVITVHSLAEIKALKFPTDGFYDIRLVMAHCHEHPDVHMLVTRPTEAPTLMLKCVEIHEARRGQGLLPVCMKALSHFRQRPVHMLITNATPMNLVRLACMHGMPVQGEPDVARMA